MSDRGQSTLDFLLGTVIFLLAVALVAGFVPGMLDPYATQTASRPLLADRAASTLAAGVLPTGDSPYVTTGERVTTVFAQSDAELRAELGLPQSIGFNVTLEAQRRTWTAGSTPPTTASVTTAWRVVSIDGYPADLIVRVW
ncbi:MAG: hypothetical protein ABEJ60_00845 [Halodesulfurarchaeum sp.]